MTELLDPLVELDVQAFATGLQRENGNKRAHNAANTIHAAQLAVNNHLRVPLFTTLGALQKRMS